MDAKNRFKTFDYFGQQEEDISTKSVGLGLSTADALAQHIGGKVKLRTILNERKQSIGAEASFTIYTVSK